MTSTPKMERTIPGQDTERISPPAVRSPIPRGHRPANSAGQSAKGANAVRNADDAFSESKAPLLLPGGAPQVEVQFAAHVQVKGNLSFT